jgi:predicted nucleotidyltransferase
MDTLYLQNTTHNEHVDAAIRAVIGLYETAFPGRIRSVYLEGSYADNTHVTNSDLDLLIIFKNAYENQEEAARAAQVKNFCSTLSTAIELDITLAQEKDFANGVRPWLKFASVFLYGEDILQHLAALSMEEWTRDRMHVSYWLLVKVFQRQPVVKWPLTYPDPDGDFYGYDQRKVRASDGSEQNSTRDLMRVTGWIATARVALEKGIYLSSKRECFTSYRQWIGDEWSSLLETMYALCREKWHYQIPDKEEERAQLRELCSRVLAWENHFLQVYKPFLLADLRSSTKAIQDHALWLMSQIPYEDQDILAAVQALQSAHDPSGS